MTAGRAAIVEAPSTISVADVEYGDPGPGEVLVRLTATGLCHTDLGVLAGGIPFPVPASSGTRAPGTSRRSVAGSPRSPPGMPCS